MDELSLLIRHEIGHTATREGLLAAIYDALHGWKANNTGSNLGTFYTTVTSELIAAKDAEYAPTYLTDVAVEINKGLALKAASRWRPYTGDDGDFTQAAMTGLVEAVSKYEPYKGSFPGYATLIIRRHVLKEARVQDYPHLSQTDFEVRHRVLGKEGTPEQIAKDQDLTTETVERIQTYENPLSLDYTTSGEEGEEIGIGHNLTTGRTPLDEVTEAETTREINELLLATLTPQEYQVIARLFGFGPFVVHTPKEVTERAQMTMREVTKHRDTGLHKLGEQALLARMAGLEG